MKSKRSLEGWIMIDHSASPGTEKIPERQRYEAGTLTCSHCHAQMLVNPLRMRERAYCRKCDRYICDQCEIVRVASGYECDTLNQRFDRMQNAMLRSPGGLLLPDSQGD